MWNLLILLAIISIFLLENVTAAEYRIEIRFSLISESDILPFVQIVNDDGKVETVAYKHNSVRRISGSNGIEIIKSEDYENMQGIYTITLPSSSSLMYKIWIKNEFSDKVVKSAKGIGSSSVLIQKDNKKIAIIRVEPAIEGVRKVKYKYVGDSEFYFESIPATDGVLQLCTIIPGYDKVDFDVLSLPYPNVVKGYVWNIYNGTPIQGASIFIDGKKQAVSDLNGEYFANVIGMGNHTIYCTYEKLKSKAENILVRDVYPSEINFKLYHIIKDQDILVSDSVYVNSYYFQFRFNSALLETHEKNEEIVEILLSDLSAYQIVSPIKITGHTDSDGADDYNLKLSYRRGQSIQSYLSKNEFSYDIVVSGKGELDPIVPNSSPSNKAKNRRVEVRFNYTN